MSCTVLCMVTRMVCKTFRLFDKEEVRMACKRNFLCYFEAWDSEQRYKYAG